MLSITSPELLSSSRIRHLRRITIGSPISKVITEAVSSVPRISSSISVSRRTPNASNCSIVCDNSRNEFSYANSASIFYNKVWEQAPVQIEIGYRTSDGSESFVQVAQYLLGDIELDDQTRTAELVLVDPFTTLRRVEVTPPPKEGAGGFGYYEDPDSDPDSGDERGTVYIDRSPAYIVEDLLTEAGFGSVIDASFTAGDTEERVAGYRLRRYEVPKGSWWNAIQPVLDEATKGIRYNASGDIEYHDFRPKAGGAVAAITDSWLAKSSVKSAISSAGIVNQYRVQMADPSGEFVDTPNSPIRDEDSITRVGEFSESREYHFLTSAPCESAALDAVAYTGSAFPQYKMTLDMRAALLELGDYVSYSFANIGASGYAWVFGKSIDIEGKMVEITLLENDASKDLWLWSDSGQLLDGSRLLW